MSANILLVEDNAADMRLVREALAESGTAAALHWVSNGEDALNFLRRGASFDTAPTPDLVLLDLNLPGLNGQEVLLEIKRDPALLHIPVVILTSSSVRGDVLGAYRAHANAYVIKPDDFEDFLKLVGALRSYWLQTVVLPSHVG
jgi:two-component system, chemotaxis family, response regulator Rcp1